VNLGSDGWKRNAAIARLEAVMGQARLAKPNTESEPMDAPRACLGMQRPRRNLIRRCMRRGLIAIVASLTASDVIFAQPLPCRYDVSDIIQAPSCGITGPPATSATAISPNGRYVAGYHAHCATSDEEAFVYDRQTREFRTLPRPAGVYSSRANDVSDAGVAVGGYWKTDAGRRGFIYDFPSATYVAELQPLPGGAWCVINAINSNGVVCGFRSIGSKGDPVNPFTAFIWDGANYTDIGVLNGPNSSALDISEDCVVVGWTGGNIGTVGTRAFIWRQSNATVLPPVPGGLTSTAEAVASQRRSARSPMPPGLLISESSPVSRALFRAVSRTILRLDYAVSLRTPTVPLFGMPAS
jgi:hypothetical protein